MTTSEFSVIEAYEQLSCMIDEMESFLRGLRVPFEVSVPCVKDHRIGMVKFSSTGWRLCYHEGCGGEWKPLRDTAAVLRLAAIKHIPALKLELEKSQGVLISQVMGSVDELEKMLNEWEPLTRL